MRALVLLACLGLAACNLYGDDGSCEYQGHTHARDSVFPAGDGCNTCSCTALGVECTLVACLPDAGVGSCAPSGTCADGPACGETCCAVGEQCVQDACLCGENPACAAGDSCEAAGPVGEDSCGSICCGLSGPCPQ